MKVLMVCLGNICRSPLAEGILRQHVEAAGLDWEVDSAGTGNWHEGEAPDPRSVEVARAHGIDISGQRARQIKASDLEEFDQIWVMDASNYQNVHALAQTPEQKAKIDLLLNIAYPRQNRPVPDPYYGGKDGFAEVFRMINLACETLVQRYRLGL